MTSGIRGDEFDDLLARTRQALDMTRGRGADDDDVQEDEPVAGTAANGLVQVAMTAGGKIDRITVDPRLLREGLETVCEAIAAATNQAIDQMRARPVPVGEVDTEALAQKLAGLQNESVRQMAGFGGALNDALDRLARSRG